MSRILVIGGYGGFGARLSRRLLGDGHQLLIAGRSADKAARFCADLEGAEAVVLDRTDNLAPILAALNPDLVIDAAGPFQGSDYAVPIACITARVSYLDLADAREFVSRISTLDQAARAAGVVVISGASSVPALSGAVARHLAGGLEHVGQVQIAISGTTHSTASEAVVKAILSYAGKPVRVWRGQQWTTEYGLQGLRRERFRLKGFQQLSRWTALAEVPDVELLPLFLPGRPSVEFRAGSDSSLHMIGLWLASWLVRFGAIHSLSVRAGWFVRLQRLTSWGKGDRSAMQVTVRGSTNSKGVERRWTLMAEQFDGPEIPVMAAALLAEDILVGRAAGGARHAAGELDLARFRALFEPLAIGEEIRETDAPPLYERAMGDQFALLPSAVRRIHAVHGDSGASGEGKVRWGRSRLAGLVCAIMRFPPAGDYPLHVSFAARGDVEKWAREFGAHAFSSVLRPSEGGVSEAFGPIRFEFALPADAEGLRMVLRRWSLFGIGLPLFAAPRIEAREWEESGRFRFSVGVAMPAIGPVIDYSGWLQPPGMRTDSSGQVDSHT